MSSNDKFVNKDGIYFVTATIVDWVDVFTRDEYRDILTDCFRFCPSGAGMFEWERLAQLPLAPLIIYNVMDYLNSQNREMKIKGLVTVSVWQRYKRG